MFEWYESFLEEWKHYIPVRWDLDDLLAKLDWVKDNDEEARGISKNARQLGENLFSAKIVSCYTYCGIKYFSNLADHVIDFDFVQNEFNLIRKVCSSKRSKRKDCFDMH